MSSMFYSLRSITELDVSNFDTSNVINMDFMFAFDIFLEKINLSNFNVEKCENFDSMFSFCEYLTVIIKNNTESEKYQLMVKEIPEKIQIKYE